MAKWCFLPYDFDTGIGTNNEGALAFSYELEDIDKLAGADVFNGQNSVLWKNLRQAYFDKIKQMYQELRSQGKLSYEDTERRFEEHQAAWSEAIFNEDSYFKYLAPLINDNTSAYLSMLQGSKAEQRKWWLYNRFRYIDSKYNAGDALTDVITVRGYAKSDITVTPYADIYASVKYGSYLTQMRALRGNSYTLKCPLDNVNDTEIYIYSASQLKDIGDLSGLKIGYAEFSLATKLQAIKVGDADESYANPNLTELHLGNNTLLRKLDVRNCPNLTQTVDISGCSNVEFAYFDGTSVAGILLPPAGILKELHLPATITNLTIRNQPSLYDLTVPDYSKITTLRLENVNKVVDSKAILKAIPANSRVRLLGIDWTAEDADDLMNLIALLDTMRGLDENGNNLDTAQVSGTISVDTVTGAQVAEIQSKYPDIKIAYQHITSFLHFYNDTGTTLLYTQSITDGADGAYSGSTPSKSSTAQYTYSFSGWSRKPGGSADSTALKAVVADRNVYAAFTATVRRYTVYFYNGSTLLQRVENVAYGSSATYTGDTPVSSKGSAEDYPFKGFVPTGKNITGDTRCYAQFGNPFVTEEITDSWETIINNIKNNFDSLTYKCGNYKMIVTNVDETDGLKKYYKNILATLIDIDKDKKECVFLTSTIAANSEFGMNTKTSINDFKEDKNILEKTFESFANMYFPDIIKNNVIEREYPFAVFDITKNENNEYSFLLENKSSSKKYAMLSFRQQAKEQSFGVMNTRVYPDLSLKFINGSNTFIYGVVFSSPNNTPVISARNCLLRERALRYDDKQCFVITAMLDAKGNAMASTVRAENQNDLVENLNQKLAFSTGYVFQFAIGANK
jgi:hypothetical protein